MEEKRYFTEEKESVLRSLPRWAKAYFAARTARRAIELINGATVDSNFIEGVKTLDEVDKAIEHGKSINFGRGDVSPARSYADRSRGLDRFHYPPDAYAALAVDDAFGLASDVAKTGRAKEGGDEYQLRKISFEGY